LSSIYGTGAHDLYISWTAFSPETEGGILHSIGNGDWKAQSTLAIRTLFAADATHVFAADYHTFLLSNGNGQWNDASPKPTYCLAGPRSIWASGPDDVYVAAAGGSPFGRGIVYHLKGGSYVAEPIDTGYPTAIWGSGPNDVYVVGGEGEIFHSKGDGVWKIEADFLSLYDIRGSGPHDVYAVGSQDERIDEGMLIAHSTGDGIWTPVRVPPVGFRASLRGIWAVSADDVYVAGSGYDGQGVILHRH